MTCTHCHRRKAVVPMWGKVLWCRQCAKDHGGMIGRRAIARLDFGTGPGGFTPEVLRRLANGPIMDSNALYLPAGKLSEAEYREREARIRKGEQP